MTSFTETQHRGGFMVSEADGHRSRETMVLAESQTLLAGAVLGTVKFGALSVTAGGGNTGNGTVTGLAAGRETKVGNYVLECIAAAVNGGTFSVVDPDGNRLDDADVGSAYSNAHLAFTINDGATDFAVGDTFTVTVPAGSGQVTELAPSATDGSQIASGILWDEKTTAVGETPNVAVVVRDAEVNGAELTYPAGITSGEKTQAIADLAAVGIIAR